MNNSDIVSKIISELGERGLIIPNKTSLINGNTDITEYSNQLVEEYEKMGNVLGASLDKTSASLLNILLAECYYQRNECYKSLVFLSKTIQLLEWGHNYTALFVALYIQMCIMIVTGQTDTIKPIVEGMKEHLLDSMNEGLMNNYAALKTWTALYDDDWEAVSEWMENSAPNEFGHIEIDNILKLFVKARVYLIEEKYVAVVAMHSAIEPVLLENSRVMDKCEIDLLTSIALYLNGNKDDAFVLLEEALEVAKERRFDRLIADEGEHMYILLKEYAKAKNSDDDYLKRVMEMSKEMAVLYPRYLRPHRNDYPQLTKMEKTVLALMIDDRSNAEISEFLDISINTVKYHSKNIFMKLGVKSRTKAARIAKERNLV